MTPREVIAYTIPGSSSELCFGLADAIIERIQAAGYVILPAAETARVVEIANRNEWSEEGNHLARLLNGGH